MRWDDDVFPQDTIDRSSEPSHLDLGGTIPINVIQREVCADTVSRLPVLHSITESGDRSSHVGTGNDVFLHSVSSNELNCDERIRRQSLPKRILVLCDHEVTELKGDSMDFEEDLIRLQCRYLALGQSKAVKAFFLRRNIVVSVSIILVEKANPL
jgi:hypothetical protein